MNKWIKLNSIIWLWIAGMLFVGSPSWATPPENPDSIIQRVVSLAPNITEILYRIDAGDRLVGRTEFCLYPPAARKIPTVGGYLNVDYEKIVSLKPELVLLLPNPEMERKLQMLNLRIFTVSNETIEEILQSITAIGRILNKTDKAREVVEGIQDTLTWIKEHQISRERISTLIVIGRESGSLRGLYVAGKNTYLSELVELCGGKNAFGDVPLRYFEVSREDLLTRNPELILEFRIIDNPNPEQTIADLTRDWQALSQLRAVATSHIYIFSERAFLIPGPRVSEAAWKLFQLFQQVGHD
ncbi:MAG: hypothetical protein D6748_00010 [Calditrichaeota bacterium]|nr:MAG: hypothetical protein D6748_00010 [Calditrichota bacterium]